MKQSSVKEKKEKLLSGKRGDTKERRNGGSRENET
jgi:hypothetical protein